MVYSLTYRRPPHVDSSRASINGEKARSIGGSMRSGSSGMSLGIPDALSFDRIINGGTCPVSSRMSKKAVGMILLMVVFSRARSVIS